MTLFNINEETPDFGVGYALLEELQNSGVITESRANIIKNKMMITESRQNTPTSYVYLDRLISWEVFKAVYTDYDRYESLPDVWRGLGYPLDLFSEGGKSADENMSKQIRRIIAHFKNTNKEAGDILVNPSERLKRYSKRFRGAQQENEDPWDQPPTREDIDPGRRNRQSNASRVIDRINSQELLSGEFYSDFSRIPPSRWGSWLRLWDREKTSVQQDRRLFGRTWKKTFVLGYQLEKNLVYEIWYNSIDSSFSLHDSRGNQVSRRFPTLSETVKSLINALVQSSSEDAGFFKNGLNNQVATSLMRSMTGNLDQHIEDMKRLEDKEQRDIIAARMEAEKKREQEEKKKEEERKKAEIARKANWDYFKRDLKQASSRVVRDFGNIAERFGVPAADAVLSKFRSGAIGLDEFLKNVVDSLDLVGSKEEKDLRGALIDDEIDIEDYIAGIRELAAKKRADRLRKRGGSSGAEATTGNNPPRPDSSMANFAARRRNTNLNEEYDFEKLMENIEFFQQQEESVDDAINSSHNSIIKSLRRDAERGQYTQNALKTSVNADLISVYTETRVDRNFPSTILPRWLNKGRKEPIVLPTDKPGLINRLKMFIRGNRYQADFIVGFSLADRVNVEIWYITEPNPEHTLTAFGANDSFSSKPTVSSFYVFDVTSGRLLRKYVPYYRNAVQIAMAKLSAQ